jgi:virginiamycin B lyase
VWFSEFRQSKIGRITPAGVITEYDLPRPNSGPGDITAGSDGAMWFLELSGTMDGMQPDGNRVGRIAMNGDAREFPMPGMEANATPPQNPPPTAINIAVGPDGNVWYTRNNRLGRVTPRGEITELPIANGPARAVGLTAGADREPPTRLTDKLWFTDGGNNRIGYLQFK